MSRKSNVSTQERSELVQAIESTSVDHVNELVRGEAYLCGLDGAGTMLN